MLADNLPNKLHAADQACRPRRTEAANLYALGRYAFVYGLLLASGNVGLLCLMTVGGIPLQGDFGAMDISRMLFRGLALVCGMLALHALACARENVDKRRWVPAIQLGTVASAFLLLGIDYGDLTATVLDFLQWMGTGCESCSM